MRLPVLQIAAALSLCLSVDASAQSHGTAGPHHGTPSPQGPYAGFEARTIKALSSADIADLRAGRGMGLALAAELNGYPGPLHVLELADALRLTPEQRERAEALFHAMRSETITIGEQIIAEEDALDRLFARREITSATLAGATQRIGAARATLRAAHLQHHLDMSAALTAMQRNEYMRLRGYGTAR